MAVSALRRAAGAFAAGAPAPVFAATGPGARNGTEDLSLRPELRLMVSPRHASILLVAGTIPDGCVDALSRIHDQLPHPRATLAWRYGSDEAARAGADEGAVTKASDPVPALLGLHRSLLEGRHASESSLLPDEPPSPWRGKGPFGQGGEGMMGGRPYGRPMAMTADDLRDGLALDRLELTLGPFFPPFPPGLALEIALQGDVVQAATVVRAPFPQPLPTVLGRVLREPVPRAELEEARARLLLRRAARTLRVAGAEALGTRALGLSVASRPRSRGVRRLRSMLRRGGSLAALEGVGERSGFDVGGRLRSWIGSAERALDRAADTRATEDGVGPVASAADLGPPFEGDPEPEEALGRLPGLLPGLEWGEAALVIASLPLAPFGAAGGGDE